MPVIRNQDSLSRRSHIVVLRASITCADACVNGECTLNHHSKFGAGPHFRFIAFAQHGIQYAADAASLGATTGHANCRARSLACAQEDHLAPRLALTLMIAGVLFNTSAAALRL